MMRTWCWALVWVGALGACEVRETGDEPRAPGAAASSQAPPAPSLAPSEVPSPPEPRLPEAQLSPANLGQLGEALGAAARAAQEASEAEGTDCERAYAGAMAMAEALQGSMGGQGAGSPQRPSRPEFLSACSQMPEAVQKCMVIGYSVTHQEECRRVREENAPQVERVRALLQGPSGPSP